MVRKWLSTTLAEEGIRSPGRPKPAQFAWALDTECSLFRQVRRFVRIAKEWGWFISEPPTDQSRPGIVRDVAPRVWSRLSNDVYHACLAQAFAAGTKTTERGPTTREPALEVLAK